MTDEPRPYTTRRRIILQVIGLIVFLVFAFFFSIDRSRYNRPSSSSRAAQSRGILLDIVELTSLSPEDKQGLQPVEAWTETVYSEVMFVFIPKKVLGHRLCVRVNYSPDGVFRLNTLLSDLEVTLNQEKVADLDDIRDSGGMTLDIPINPIESFPPEGEIHLTEKLSNTESTFRYQVKPTPKQ